MITQNRQISTPPTQLPNAKKTARQRILRWLKTIYLKIFRINDSPHKIAAGFGLGVFLGILPATGIVAAIFLAVLFRVNRASAILGSLLTNTWVTIPFLFMSVQISAKLSRTPSKTIDHEWSLLWQDFHWTRLFEHATHKLLIPVIAGYLILSFCAGILAYIIILTITWHIKKNRSSHAN